MLKMLSVLLLTITMTTDGYTVAETIREVARQTSEFIGCVAYDEMEDAQKCLEGIGLSIVEGVDAIIR